MNGTDLAFAIGLPPEKAIEHLAAKGLKVSGGWRTVDEATHARAFTVANVTKLDVLADIQAELARAQKDGLTMQQFRANIIPALTRKGWFAPSGAPVHVPDGTPPDPKTGELATQKRLTARRLKTIFQTNMQSSMMAGRYRELMANADKRPFFQYVAVLDGRTRPAHRALNGRVFRADDAAWGSIWPPNGWGCRCRVRALDAADMADKGLKVESSQGHLKTSSVPLPDGSTSTITRYTPVGGTTFSTDPGFNGNPAQVQAADRLAVLRAPQVLPAPAADQALRQLFTNPTRTAELQTFAQTAREVAKPTGARLGVGELDEAAVLHLVDEGVSFDPTQPITLGGDLVRESPDITPEQWAAVPEVLAYGTIGWDKRISALYYVRTPDALWREGDMRVVVKATNEGNRVDSVEVVGGPAVVPAFERVRGPGRSPTDRLNRASRR